MTELCIAPRVVDGHRGRCEKPREPGSLFCRRHEQAPAAKRGGWLSAEKRRRKLASHEHPLDVSNVFTRLWVGGKPPVDRDLPDFEILVLCAQEIQPEHMAFQGTVLRCPLPDGPLSNIELSRTLIVARVVSEQLVMGRRVLVTCAAGINRSALVASLALSRVTRMSAAELVELMRRTRNPKALYNQHFRELLQKLVGDGRRRYW